MVVVGAALPQDAVLDQQEAQAVVLGAVQPGGAGEDKDGEFGLAVGLLMLSAAAFITVVARQSRIGTALAVCVGDLLPGLAWQAVHDGAAHRHKPIRLHVQVAAEPARIDAVVAGHGHLRDLVSNAWIALHALDPATGACRRRLPDGGWTEVAP